MRRAPVPARSLRNDWRRWSAGERVAALTILAASMMSSFLLVLNGH